VDYFAALLGQQAWTMESLADAVWPLLPRANRRVGLLLDQRLRRELLGRARTRPVHLKRMSELVGFAAERAETHLGVVMSEHDRTGLVRRSARRLAGYPVEANYVEGLLKTIAPRLAIVEEGCYSSMAVFNAAARAAGVTVAEFQHGMVTGGHDAYNVAPTLSRSAAYRETQPSAFLAYGRWWTEQFSAPVPTRVVVGNPHRSEVLKNWMPAKRRDRVLVIGDGIETDAYLEFCQQLAATSPADTRISFRPHPRERRRVALSGHPFEIDREPDLYESLAATRTVIAERSTALFEAVGLVPEVLVWDTPKSQFYLGEHPFPRFRDVHEAVSLLSGPMPPSVAEQFGADVWAADWERRFSDYAAPFIGTA
jgi:hypothetical protein